MKKLTLYKDLEFALITVASLLISSSSLVILLLVFDKTEIVQTGLELHRQQRTTLNF